LPEPILSPGLKKFLESYSLGRLGIQAARQTRKRLRDLRDPVQHKTWMRQFILPLRNLMLGNRPINVSIDGTTIRMEPRGATAGDIWTGMRCETQEVSFILSVLEPGMTFFDVGANAGLFAISAAKKIGAKQVFAFEPCASTSALLKKNVQLNGVADVNLAQLALGDSIGKATLQVNAPGKDGLNTLGKPTHPDSAVVQQEEVSVSTVDAFLQQHNISRVDVMKVDIEGAELMLFRGARALLQRSDAPLVLYEGFGFLTRGFGYHPVEILWLLESCGYSLFTLNSESGAIAELGTSYQYDSMVVAVKPENPRFANWRAKRN
jgi:FkbM family methyltransferase